MAGIEIMPVRRRAEMKAFINLPWRIYKKDPNWVPPIKSEMARLLNPEKHPFWKFSERELYLARSGSEVVGRIAAIVDGNYNRYHNEKMGIWGFFECTQNPEAAAGLFGAAEKWIRNKGMDFIRGPLNPSTNYEVGMLIQGFDSPPTLMMTYNPPYYPELVHLCGFDKEKDLFAYLFTWTAHMQNRSISLIERIMQRGKITVRPFDRHNLKNELRMMNRIYNECWANNWGFVPMTEGEIDESAKNIAHILDTDLAFFLYYKDEPAGVCLILPDANPLLKRLNGRLGPFALIKKHLYWSEITGMRGLLLGVKEKYYRIGLPAVAIGHVYRVLKDKYQNIRCKYLELGWNLEDNKAINELYERSGARPYKRYRIYRMNLYPKDI